MDYIPYDINLAIDKILDIYKKLVSVCVLETEMQ